jgi:PAS domain S-box-containing protein
MLGPTDASRTSRLMRSLLLYAPFWLAGTIILIFLQPRDLRWRLLVLFNYVTAIWLAAGIYSDLRVAYTSPVQHAFAWLLALASLHLHLAVPSPLLRRHQRYVLPPLYAIAAVLAVLEIFQALPGTAFYLGLFLAFLGCFGPLVFRLLARPFVADRLAVRLMLAGISLGLGPGIILAIIPALLGASLPAGLALNVVEFATPLLPFFYIYAIYKRRLSGEFRANRLLSLYSFVALYATAFILVFSIGSQWLGLPDSPMVFSLIVSMVFIVAALPLRVRFQQLIDRLAYGTEHNPDDIIRVFASRIPAGLSLEALGQLLADEVAPSLLIRQSALLLLADGSPCDGDTSTVYARGVNVAETPKTLHQVEQLLGGAGQYRPPLAEARGEFDWVRLVIPLQIREKTVGGWLFGRRDPDDYYPQDDIMLLTALASQVAVAIENAQLAAEALRESEEKYRNVVERANDGITIIQDTTVKYANPRLAEMWGGIAEEIVDTPFADYVHPSELLKAADRYKRRMAGEDVAPVYETVLRRKDSGKVYVELNAIPVNEILGQLHLRA